MLPRPLRLAAALVLAALLAACGGDPPAPPQKVDGKTRREWVAALESDDGAEQVEALGALARFDHPPLEKVAGFLDSADADVRAAAIRALGAFGPEAAKWAPDLAVYLEEDPKGFDKKQAKQIRDAAIVTLGKIGLASWSHMRHLLVSRDARQRARVVFTIRPFVGEIQGVSKALTPLMKDKSWIVRRETARALGLVGKDDDYAAEALMDGLEDENRDVIRAAAISLGNVGGSADVEGRALADKLIHYGAGVRSAAVYSLGLMGEEATPFLQAIADLMKNDNKRLVRIEAARAHWRISGDAEAALEVLAKDVRCDEPGMRRFALRALAQFGPQALPMLPALVEMLGEPEVRDLAVAALGAIGPEAKEALPPLTAVAEEAGSDDPALAKLVAEAVAAIGGAK